jgi:dihydrofolate reductase
MAKLIYYVASSIDGFIAGPDGSIDFYPFEPDLADFIRETYPETLPTPYRRALGFDDVPNRTFDTVVMGHGTYQPGLDQGLTSPYAHLEQYVFAHGVPPAPEPNVHIVEGDPVPVVRDLKARDGLDVWLCGGGALAGQLRDEIDEWIVKLSPVVVGAGVPVLAHGFDPLRLELAGARPLPSGVVVLHYRRIR